MQRVDAGRYEILISPGLLDQLGEHVAATAVATAATVAIISDSDVAPLYAERVRASLLRSDSRRRVELFVVPSGEATKSRREWALLSDAMLARGLGRDSAVVALGGGVITDLAGFVAATYARGVPVVQVPTSLLAMVDASVGGKTGVDTPAGKNLVGAFHWPSLVAIDTQVLSTLGVQHVRAGFAEMIKHGAIADESHFQQVSEIAGTLPNVVGPESLAAVIADSINIKVRVVARDEREAGPRRALNAGHTLAHALEHVSQYAILHGEAVAIGLAVETMLGERVGATEEGTAGRIRAALSHAGLPTAPPSNVDPATLVAATRSDKKTRQGLVEYSLIARIGQIDEADGRFSRRVDDNDVLAVLRAAQGLAA